MSALVFSMCPSTYLFQGQYEEAYEYGCLALETLERTDIEHKRVCLAFATVTALITCYHYKNPLSDMLDELRQTRQTGELKGEYADAILASYSETVAGSFGLVPFHSLTRYVRPTTVISILTFALQKLH